MTQNLVADKIKAKVSAGDIRPEVELILCCARTNMDATNAKRIKALLQEDLDWAYLIHTAARHRIIPLLYQSLKNTYPEAVPKTILNQLRGYFHSNAVYNLLLTKELLKLLNLFKDHDIAAIPFKGPVLAASAYGNLALRQFCDLDILVHERDILKAKDLLMSQGYQPKLRLNIAQEAAYRKIRSAHGFLRDDGKVRVDLQWGISVLKYFSFPINDELFWERLETIPVLGTKVLNIAPEELLQILCVHGSRHIWERLAWICDVAELIRIHQDMDWNRCIEQARMLGNERMLFLGLLLAHEFLGTAVPEVIWQRMQGDSVVKMLAAQVRELLFCEGALGLFKHLEFYSRLRERLEDRVFTVLQLAINPDEKDWALLPLPASVSFLYYLVRPIRLAGKYGLGPLKRCLGF